MIDIGGPALLRAAAKNFVDVVPSARRPATRRSSTELNAGGIELDTRRELAAEAFAHTAAYETSIAAWFADLETFPPRLLLSLERETDLAYGENPHQRAAYYAEAGVRRHLLSRVDLLGGRELSFNNLNDLDAARAVLREFALPACVDRQAREPVRGRRRGHDRGGLREGARRRSGVRLRRRRGAQPQGLAASSRPRLAEQFVEV